jgi:hypothetical protein
VTGLLAGSILLLGAAAGALVLGWAGANETLIWTSIASSVGAAICLALAYHHSRAFGKVARATTTRRPRPAAKKRPSRPKA